MDIRKQDFSREELADYIAADGKITVRYTAGSNAEIGVSQTLPLLMVTGRKADVEDTGTEKNSEILRLSPGLIWKWRRGALWLCRTERSRKDHGDPHYHGTPESR